MVARRACKDYFFSIKYLENVVGPKRYGGSPCLQRSFFSFPLNSFFPTKYLVKCIFEAVAPRRPLGIGLPSSNLEYLASS